MNDPEHVIQVRVDDETFALLSQAGRVYPTFAIAGDLIKQSLKAIPK